MRPAIWSARAAVASTKPFLPSSLRAHLHGRSMHTRVGGSTRARVGRRVGRVGIGSRRGVPPLAASTDRDGQQQRLSDEGDCRSRSDTALLSTVSYLPAFLPEPLRLLAGRLLACGAPAAVALVVLLGGMGGALLSPPAAHSLTCTTPAEPTCTHAPDTGLRLAESSGTAAEGESATPATEAEGKPSQEAEAAPKAISDMELLEEAWKVVDENYLVSRGRTFDREVWLEQLENARKNRPTSRSQAHGQIRGLLSTLKDPYTRFLSPTEFQGLSKYDITGIGLNIADAADSSTGIRIMGLVLESPSAQAGARQGDEVLEINGRSVTGLTAFQAATRIQSAESPTVTLKLRHKDGSVVTIACERAQRLSSPVEYRLEKPSTGYIKLSEFNALAGRDVANAVTKLSEKGADRFVLDLRDNPGGLVQAGSEIARLFMGGDVTVVYTENRPDRPGPGPPTKAVTTRGEQAITTAPLMVLVNSRTASASEIVAGSLHDNCRAALVGNRTFGKGLIQSVYELSDGSGLVLTVGKYLTPSRIDIDQQGITPDFPTFPGFEAANNQVNNKCVRPSDSKVAPAPGGVAAAVTS